jgi:hypothetical protein
MTFRRGNWLSSPAARAQDHDANVLLENTQSMQHDSATI